jgi:hypothetical protein
MQTDVSHVFHFHADASALGGFLENPFRHIPTPSSVALSSSGGTTTHEAGEFHFEDRVHAKASYTHASGKHVKRNGPWTQHVSSVVEGFDLFGRVTADRLVAQIAIEHPEIKGPRMFSFAGSRIENLRIDGKPVSVTFNPTLAPAHERNVAAYNQDSTYNPDTEWSTLWKTAHTQGANLLQQPGVPAWIRERFGWAIAEENSGGPTRHGHTVGSLVDQIEGLEPELSFGHYIDVPDLGRIFLAQVRIYPHSANLTMLRAELGCDVTGVIDAGSAGSNGSTYPPS